LAAVADDLDAAIETAAPALAPIMPSLAPATT
jgi:hypothetical protein